MILRNFITAVCLFITFNLFAQDHVRYIRISDASWIVSNNLPIKRDNLEKYIVEHDIDSIQLAHHKISAKGKMKPTRYGYAFHFNDKGQLVQYDNLLKGKIRYTKKYEYDHNNRVVKEEYYKKRVLRSTGYQSYQSGLIVADYFKVNHKGDTTFKLVRTDINDSFISHDYYFDKGKLRSHWKNEYYENHTLKKSTLYKANGKPKYVWDYACKEEGVEVLKHKDTTKVCHEMGTDKDGITTLIYQYVSEKGELIKTISKTNKAGQTVYFKRSKGIEDIPVAEYEYRYADNDSTLTHLSHKRYSKGKLYSTFAKEYDKNENQTKGEYIRYKKGEVKSRRLTTFEYNVNKLPIKRLYKNQDKGSGYLTEFSY